MKSPYRIIRNVRVRKDARSNELVVPPPRFEGDEDAAVIDAVPLEDVEILRRKANAWDYAVRRGFLTSSKVQASLDFARLDPEEMKVDRDVVLLFRTPELDPDALRDLGDQLSALFPDNRVVIYPTGTGGLEALPEDQARALPGIGGALDELAERRTPARKAREE